MAPLTDEEYEAETARRRAAAKDKQASDAAASDAARDHYYAVKSGDTFESIAKALGHDGEGQALMDTSHGGPTNAEQAAGHAGRLAGSEDPPAITSKTKLIEGLSLLLPEGWRAPEA
jgi:hypothetical protein